MISQYFTRLFTNRPKCYEPELPTLRKMKPYQASKSKESLAHDTLWYKATTALAAPRATSVALLTVRAP
jgi:hypothetical protein